jgi:hypothetical protein
VQYTRTSCYPSCREEVPSDSRYAGRRLNGRGPSHGGEGTRSRGERLSPKEIVPPVGRVFRTPRERFGGVGQFSRRLGDCPDANGKVPDGRTNVPDG